MSPVDGFSPTDSNLRLRRDARGVDTDYRFLSIHASDEVALVHFIAQDADAGSQSSGYPLAGIDPVGLAEKLDCLRRSSGRFNGLRGTDAEVDAGDRR